MKKEYIVYLFEAPDNNYLKEVVKHSKGNRLVFTNYFYDEPIIFHDKKYAEDFKEENNLNWLAISEHMIMG